MWPSAQTVSVCTSVSHWADVSSTTRDHLKNRPFIIRIGAALWPSTSGWSRRTERHIGQKTRMWELWLQNKKGLCFSWLCDRNIWNITDCYRGNCYSYTILILMWSILFTTNWINILYCICLSRLSVRLWRYTCKTCNKNPFGEACCLVFDISDYMSSDFTIHS